MFDTIRFLWKVRHYLKVSRMPHEQRLRRTAQRCQRLFDIAIEDVPFYRDRQKHGKIPEFDKNLYHQWDLPDRLNHPDAYFLSCSVNAALNEHDSLIALGHYGPIRPFWYGKRGYLAYRTSGTTGRPMKIVRPLSNLIDLAALQMARGTLEPKTLGNVVRRMNQRVRWACLVRGPGAFPGFSLLSNQPVVADRFTQRLVMDLSRMSMKEARQCLELFQPEILTTYASVLAQIADEGWTLPSLELAVSMSEPLTDAAKMMIMERMPGTFVSDHYAMGECPTLTTACPMGRGAHVNDDVAMLLPCKADGSPCEEGQASDYVLVSDFLNDVQPFLFYRVDDQIVMDYLDDRPCACGSRQPIVTAVHGRKEDNIVLEKRDGTPWKLSSSFVRMFMLRFPSVIDWQLVYGSYAKEFAWRDWQRHNELHMRCVFDGATTSSPFQESIIHVIAEGLAIELAKEDVAIHVDVVATPALVPDQRTGKVKRFINLVQPKNKV